VESARRSVVSLTESERHQIIQWFQEQMGPERGELMMKAIAPVGWSDLATTRDLRELENQLRAEMHVLGADLRTEMAHLRTDLRTEMADLRTDLRTETASLRADLHNALRLQVYAILGGGSVLLGLVAAVGRILG
jgi:hypothetical protein